MCGFYVLHILFVSNLELYAENTTINVVPVPKTERDEERERGARKTSTTPKGRYEMQF
jgi:hypothetical protein